MDRAGLDLTPWLGTRERLEKGGLSPFSLEQRPPCYTTPPRDTFGAVDACPLLETIAAADMTGPSTHVLI